MMIQIYCVDLNKRKKYPNQIYEILMIHCQFFKERGLCACAVCVCAHTCMCTCAVVSQLPHY